MVIDISTVAQRIDCTEGFCHGTSDAQRAAPCVIGILNNCRAAGVQDGGNVALQVGGIVVVRTVVGDGHGSSGYVVGKVQGINAHGLLAQTADVVDVIVGSCTICPLRSQAVCVVGVRPGGTAIGHGSQLAAMLPGIGPCTVGKRIADLVMGNGPSAVFRQKVTPGRIAVGVAVAVPGI